MLLTNPLAHQLLAVVLCQSLVMIFVDPQTCIARTTMSVFQCNHELVVTFVLEEITHLPTAIAALKHLCVLLQVLQQW